MTDITERNRKKRLAKYLKNNNNNRNRGEKTDEPVKKINFPSVDTRWRAESN